MYYLFMERSIMPGSYYNLPAGDKVVIRAFFERHMESMNELRRDKGGRRNGK
jgi:hypothetical protein